MSSTSEHFVPGSSTAKALWRAARRQLSIDGLRRTPPIWRERRIIEELAVLRRHPLSAGIGLPRGDGLPVFLIPGYLAGDPLFEPMARALRAAGYRPASSGVRLNVGCASAMFGPLEARLEALVARTGGQRAFVVGQSRGGGFAKWLGVRRPDLVAGVVTLGSPLLDPLALNLLMLVNVGLVGALGTLGLPGLLSTSCLRPEGCCAPVWRELARPLPEDVPFASIYSRSDGVVDWRACLDPHARHVQVESSHCGMLFNVEVMQAIGAELAAVVGQEYR
jgi:pimeloyl-ACP methyl ester carboxylesterase